MEAMSLAESTARPSWRRWPPACWPCARRRSATQACEQAAAPAARRAGAGTAGIGPIGLGYLALNQGRLDDADAHYRIVRHVADRQGLMRWEPEWVETLIRAGRRAEAVACSSRARADARPELLIAHGRERVAKGCSPTTTPPPRALNARVGRVAGAVGNPFGEGRTELIWGERLRRARRRAEARAHLARAVELLRGVGATVLAERATTELRAAGGVVGDDVASHQLLTPHELQVARLVVGGASNRDLAAKLFISPRTVEAHLTAIFRKLGVRNRRELSARAIDDPVLQP